MFNPEKNKASLERESTISSSPEKGQEMHELSIDAGNILSALEQDLSGAEKISETSGEDKKIFTGSANRQPLAQPVSSLKIQNFPAQTKMIEQIRKKIQMEIKEVKLRVKEAEKKKDYHLLNKLLAHLRSLVELFGQIKDATNEFVKNLWIKYIRGNTIN